MTGITCPEGVTVTLNYYLVSAEGVEAKLGEGELQSLPALGPSLDVNALYQHFDLDKMGSGWRVMTREEIADYWRRDIEGDDE